MEESLVLWLITSGPTNNEYSKEWIIENLRILSNNGLHITFKSLRELFEQVEHSTTKYGLNNEQLLLLYDSIKPIISEYGCSGNLQEYYVYHFTHIYFKEFIESINPNYTKEINKKPIMLLDIIRNNKKHLISSYLKTTNISNDGSQLKDIDNSILFFKVWRNVVIRNYIMDHYSKFRNHYNKFKFSSILELDNYKFKHYLRNVEIELPSKSSISDDNTFGSELNGEMINDYLEYKLPSSIEILRLSGDHINGIRLHSIPSTVTSLQFNQDYSGTVKHIDLNLPLGIEGSNKLDFKGVKKLIFNRLFYRSELIDGSIPEGIENISFVSVRDYTFKFTNNSFPNTLKTLSVGRNIEEKENNFIGSILPNGITKLKLNCYHSTSESFLKSLPSSITNLNIKNYPDLTLNSNGVPLGKDSLPPNLKILNLNYLYEFKYPLPKTLVVLKLSELYISTFLPGVLPETLEELSFLNDRYIPRSDNDIIELLFNFSFKNSNRPCLIEGSLPVSLKKLKLSPYINHMDTLIEPVLKQCINLTKLTVIPTHASDYKFRNKKQLKDPLGQSIHWSNHLKYIPSSVISIKCISDFTYPHFIQSIPSTEFKFIEKFNPPPNSTEQLNLLNYKLFGNNITKFTFNNRYYQQIPLNILPSNLTILNFGSSYDKPIIPQLLPQSLTSLSFFKNKNRVNYEEFSFQSKFNQPLDSTNIPIGLKQLTLSSDFTQPIDIDNVFPNLVTLFIGNSNPTPFIYNSTNSPNLKHIFVFNTNIEFLNSNIHLNQSILKIVNYNSKHKNILKLINKSYTCVK